MERSIYLDREDAKSIEEEERSLFLRGILEKIGVPLDDIWPDKYVETIDQKIKLRGLLSKLNIEIIYDGDRGCKIYHEDELLAEWFKPRFLLKRDNKAKTIQKKFYYEMKIKTWDVFENQEKK